MHLKSRTRPKDGKTHRSNALVESRREGHSVRHKHVFYLGEIADGQRRSREDALEVFDGRQGCSRQLRLFASECSVDEGEVDRLHVRLSGLSVRRPRKWGGCRLADNLGKQLGLDGFSRERLGRTRKGTN